MPRVATVGVEIEVVDNLTATLKQALKQVKKFTSAVEAQQKVQQKSSAIIKLERAAIKKLNTALDNQYIARRTRQREKLLVATGQLTGAVTALGKAEEKAAAVSAKAQKSQTDAAYKERTNQINAQKDAQMKADRARQASAENASKAIAASRKKAEEASSKAMQKMAAEQDRLAKRKIDNIQKASRAAQQRAAAEVKTEGQISKARAKGFAQAEKAIAQQKQQDMAKFTASKKLEDRAANAKISAARSAGKAAAKEINKELTIAKRSAVARAKVEQKASETIAAAKVKASEKASKAIVRAAAKSRKAAEKSAQREIALSTKLAEMKVRNSLKAAKAAERAHSRDLKASKRKNEKILRDIRKRREANAKMHDSIAKKAKQAAKQELKANKAKRISFASVGKAAMRLFFIIETLRRMFQMLSAAINVMFIEPIKSFAAFETGMAEVSTLLGKDISKEAKAGVAGLTDSVKDLAIQFGKAPVDMAKALYFAVSAGATTAKEAQEVLRVSTMLSTAGLIDAETATRALVTVMNAYGISFMDAEQVSDLFFITVQKGITTVKELANKVGRVAGIAASAGMDIQTMFAFIAAGTKVTGLTTATVTGLRSAIQLLLKPGKTARDRMQALGISFGKAALKGENFSKWVTKVREKMRGMTEDGKKLSKSQRITSEDLAVMLPNLRAQAVVMGVVAAKTNLFAQELLVMKDASKTSGATAEAVNKIMETFTFKMQRAQSALEVLKIEFGETMVEGMGLKGFLDGVAVAVTGIIAAFRKYKDDEPLSNIGKSLETLGKDLTFFTADVMLTLIRTTFRGAQAFTALALSITKVKGLLPGGDAPPITNELLRAVDIAQRIKRKPGSQLQFPPLHEGQTTDTVDSITESLLTNESAVSDIYEKMVKEVARRKVAIADLLKTFADKREDPFVKKQVMMDRAILADLKKVTAAFKARRDALIEAPKQQAKEEQRLEKALDAQITALQRLDEIAAKVAKTMRKGADESINQAVTWKTLLKMLSGDIDLGGGGGGGTGKKDSVVSLISLRERALEFYSRRLKTINDQQKAFTIPGVGLGKDKTIFFPEPEVEKEQQRQDLAGGLAKRFGATTKEQLKVIRKVMTEGNKIENARKKDVKTRQAEELAAKKAFYLSDSEAAEAQRNRDRNLASHNMEQALIDIESDLKNKFLTETQAEQAKEEAKLKILSMFQKHRHAVIKSAMNDTIQGYQTEVEIRQDVYDADIEAQLVTIAKARVLYAEKLAFIQQTANSEVEIELRKEHAKREITKQFTQEGEVNKKKEATKGITIAEKDDKNKKRKLKEAQREEEQRIKGLEKMAESAASTIVSMGSTLISDLLDKEKTAAEAFKSLGRTLLEMAATSLAEFIIGEAIKSVLITTTATTSVVADQTRLASGLSADAALIASAKALAVAKLGASTAGLGLLGGLGLGALGLGLVGGLFASGTAGFGSASEKDKIAEGNARRWEEASSALAEGVAAAAASVGFDPGREERRRRRKAAYDDQRRKEALGYAHGGLVRGGIPGQDSVPAMLMPGEFVLNRDIVEAIRRGARPKTITSGLSAPAPAPVVFAPVIQTVALPNSAQNQRYYRDTVRRTQNRLNANGYK